MKFRFPWQKRPPDLSRFGESNLSLEETQNYEGMARLNYVSNTCKMILPSFDFKRTLGVRCFDDQSLAGGVTGGIFLNYILYGGNAPTYDNIFRALSDVYIQTRAEFLRDPNPFNNARLFFQPELPDGPDIQDQHFRTFIRNQLRGEDQRIRAIIVDMIRDSPTFLEYLNHREQLYREFNNDGYRVDTHDYSDDIPRSR